MTRQIRHSTQRWWRRYFPSTSVRSVAAADLQPAAAFVLVVDPEERPRIDSRLVAEVLSDAGGE